MESSRRTAWCAGLLALAATTGCRQTCRDEWDQLRSSPSAKEERVRAERFSDCVLEHQLHLAYSVKDPKSGALLSDGQLAKQQGPVRVEIDVAFGWKEERLVWNARSMDSVWPLFRE